MLKIFLKILATLTGLALLGYILSSKLKIWELEVIKEQSRSSRPDSNDKSPGSSEKYEPTDLAAIRAKSGLINFERIGSASASEKDDLKKIKGIGTSIEQKLNALDIYTFDQIANFTPEDEHVVGDIIAFFPGRIERDEWVQQARALKKSQKPEQ